KFRGLGSNQRPPRSERGVTTSSNCPGFGKEDSNLHAPASKAGGLPLADSRERHARVELAYPVWKTSAWTARPMTPRPSLRMRDRGVEPRSPGWKPGVVPLDQSRGLRAEREGVEPSRLIARPDSSRVPSPFGLPFPIIELRRQESNLRPPG